jgi:hypothetical protein
LEHRQLLIQRKLLGFFRFAGLGFFIRPEGARANAFPLRLFAALARAIAAPAFR